MPDTTYEEAKRCPRCSFAGDDRHSLDLPPGEGKMHYFYCINARCEWYNTPWMVQIKPDGSIPDRTKTQGENQFQPQSEGFKAMGRRFLEDALQRDLRDER